MSRPKIAANQVNASGSTSGQVLTSNGTDAAWTTPPAKVDAMPNAAPTTVSRSYVSNGDANGVFYFLGTGLGANVWANPQTSAQIVAVRSTDGAGTVADIFDRTTNATYTNGGALGDFIFVDLGANRSLVPNYYSLRNYNQANREMRTWKLQGTNSVAGTSVAQINAATWTDLDVRSNDTTMSGANAWANYTPNQSNTTAFRYLRILQTGNDATGNPYICVAEWELYGTFTYTSGALADGRLVQLNGATGDELRQTAFSAEGGQLSAATNIEIRSTAANGSVTLTPSGTGTTNLGGSVTIPSLTANRVILSNGTGALQTVAPGTSGNVLQSNGTTWVSAALTASGADFQTFTSSGTWTKPTNAKTVEVICIGGGGGGGSGRRGAAATFRRGGGGGGGGALSRMVFPASLLGGTETVTVDAGGTAGAAQTTDSTNGNAGGAGGDTTFGNWVFAGGGGAGAGGIEGTGTVTAGNGGSAARLGAYTSATAVAGQGAIDGATAGCAEYGGAAGGRNSTSDNQNGGFSGGSSMFGGPGGGGGGPCCSDGKGYAAGNGGNTASYTTGGGASQPGGGGTGAGPNGNAGAAPSSSLCGTGGAGGGGGGTTGGNGGAGGRGAGGGGGGGSSNGNASGAGGAGGAGIVYVITYL